MALSYLCRVLCLALCCAGLLQVLLEAFAWSVSGAVMAAFPEASVRSRERRIFLLALGARLAPIVLLAGVLVPAYMRQEDNHGSERVGLLCMVLAAGTLVWFAASLVRVAFAVVRSNRFRDSCTAIGRTEEGIPLRLAPGIRPVLAVTGIFSATILLSRNLLDESRFSSPALQAAFAHEGAHARQHDNFKLLLLTALPHLGFRSSGRASLEQQWRLQAELAADEEGTGKRGSHRAVLLAEMLVSLARENTMELPFTSIALLDRSDDLRVRVMRLLGEAEPAVRRFTLRGALQAAYAIILPALVVGVLVYGFAHAGHRVAEFVLRLGA
ncbi:MAG TPA: hypothetical protein VGN16_04680 [Acidobacteriaceae bacterium]|jgi:hypothetical protein